WRHGSACSASPFSEDGGGGEPTVMPPAADVLRPADHSERWYLPNARVANSMQTAVSAARSPTRPATRPQSIFCIAPPRAATTAQLTGLNLATDWIQPGARLCCINAADRNVSGNCTSVTAPISVSRWRASTATPLDSDANAAPNSAATRIISSTP